MAGYPEGDQKTGGSQWKGAVAEQMVKERASNEGDKQRRYGIAVIGLGRSGQFHLTSIKSLPEMVRLVWAIDVNENAARRVASDMKCKWDTSIDKALADPEVDIVVIASTTDTHFPFIMSSLGSMKAVFTEKPISHEVDEVQTAVDFAKKNNLIFVCGYQRRCDVNFRDLKRQLDIGAIGKLKMIKSCSRDNPVPPMEYLRTSGGIFQDMLIHDFDMQMWLTNEVPESLHSVGHCYSPEIAEMGDIDTVAVVIKYESGIITMIDTSRDAAYGYDQRVEVFGSDGMLTAKNEMTSSIELATKSGHLQPPAMWSFPQRYKHAYTVEMCEFAALVHAGRDSDAHKLEQQAMMRHPLVVKAAAAAEYSLKLGRPVYFSEDLKALDAELKAFRSK